MGVVQEPIASQRSWAMFNACISANSSIYKAPVSLTWLGILGLYTYYASTHTDTHTHTHTHTHTVSHINTPPNSPHQICPMLCSQRKQSFHPSRNRQRVALLASSSFSFSSGHSQEGRGPALGQGAASVRDSTHTCTRTCKN